MNPSAICLLLACLCLGSSWSVSSGTVEVTQSPDVSVTEGETLKISCCWRGKVGRLRVHWLKNQTKLSTDIFITKNDTPGFLQRETSKCSYFTFLKITRQDSGRYFCSLSVEIPYLINIRGSGTVITVTFSKYTEDDVSEDIKDDVSESDSDTVLLHLLRCLPVLALIGTFYCLNRLVREAPQQTADSSGNKIAPSQRVEEEEENEEEVHEV